MEDDDRRLVQLGGRPLVVQSGALSGSHRPEDLVGVARAAHLWHRILDELQHVVVHPEIVDVGGLDQSLEALGGADRGGMTAVGQGSGQRHVGLNVSAGAEGVEQDPQRRTIRRGRPQIGVGGNDSAVVRSSRSAWSTTGVLPSRWTLRRPGFPAHRG